MNTEKEKRTKHIVLSDLSNLYPQYEQIVSIAELYNKNNLPDMSISILQVI